ncbi:MAG: YopX family protein [Eubacteriales bacterium]|nr:YopX family protein [Eubacteriales bacterium]
MRNYSIDEVPRGMELENIYSALKELRAYMDSGLTPEQVQELQNKVETKETINQLYMATVSMLGSEKDVLISKVNSLSKQLSEYQVLGTSVKRMQERKNMREILFKAKRKDTGKWAEGFLMDKNYINVPLGDDSIFFGMQYEIDPDTICQYTGLTDQNGEKIWENGYISDGQAIWQVRYSESMSGFYAQSVAGNKDGHGDCFSLWHLCHRHNKGRQVVYSDDRNELSRKMIERRQKHE